MQLISYKTNPKTGEILKSKEQDQITFVNQILCYIQLILSILVLFFCMIERYKVSCTQSFIDMTETYINDYKQQSGQTVIDFNILNKFLNYLNGKPRNDQYFLILLKLLFDKVNAYNILYVVISFLTLRYDLLYCILLLDVVKQSEDLTNIVFSILMNIGQLGKTILLTIICIFIFTIFAYSNLNSYYQESENVSMYADSLLIAFVSTSNYGLRSDGGIGDAMRIYDPKTDPAKDLTYLVIFQLSFFMIINILFINIIFGIVIDTFGQLRDNKKSRLEEINGKCYICGISKSRFDNEYLFINICRGNGWLEHIYLEHNLYNYLYFLILIEDKESNACNGLEKYIKQQIRQNKKTFFPIQQAMCLPSQDEPS